MRDRDKTTSCRWFFRSYIPMCVCMCINNHPRGSCGAFAWALYKVTSRERGNLPCIASRRVASHRVASHRVYPYRSWQARHVRKISLSAASTRVHSKEENRFFPSVLSRLCAQRREAWRWKSTIQHSLFLRADPGFASDTELDRRDKILPRI